MHTSPPPTSASTIVPALPPFQFSQPAPSSPQTPASQRGSHEPSSSGLKAWIFPRGKDTPSDTPPEDTPQTSTTIQSTGPVAESPQQPRRSYYASDLVTGKKQAMPCFSEALPNIVQRVNGPESAVANKSPVEVRNSQPGLKRHYPSVNNTPAVVAVIETQCHIQHPQSVTQE
ncbi:hypothetical protein FDECE_14571 [Fusarium decemcellulare]|nr:hypothetical protein FDECE_14571 [Fusarium decemcellulare]